MKTLLPKLRFPEFQDAPRWEAKQLANISPAVFDGTHQTPTYIAEGIPFYSVENIVSGAKNKFISYDDYAIATGKNKPEKGDILLTRIGKIGFSQVVTWDYDFSVYVTLAVIKGTKSFVSHYLHYFIQSNRYQNELFSKALLNAVPPKINMDSLRSTEILLPKPAEQQKIADCLTSLDELITAQSQKVSALKAYKKGLMQKLFPAVGGSLPRLRFPEFESAREWELKKLKNVSPAVFDGTHQTPTYITKGIPFYSVENIVSGNKNKFISREDYVIATNKNKPEKGDILLTRIGKIGYSQVVTWDHDFSVYVTLAVIKQSKSFNSHYLHYFMQSNRYQTELFSKALLNAVPPKINMDSLRDTEILLPERDEQQRIAEFLTSIDEQISVQSEMVEKLKSHKKGLMQGLFPSVDEV